ncbi:MBL fold metallo-hydrolase [bacterium]|nr:MBL fold metallo-hydrolase [bacterium]
MTNLKFLSHASAIVESNDIRVLMDPWLIGSCYWRSWWNYPPVSKNEIKDLNVDAIYITHVHWDHWHGPSLKKLFDKDTLIITHNEPNKRSVNDLRTLGFKNIKLLKHGERFKIGNIQITPYQFGLFLNDSALVVETPEMKLLNANDCKIAGSALRQIINRHGPFDFALRSHSSANDRVCYSVKAEDFSFDDRDHYSRSFALFMDAVKPKYAIPFASNHCHLHKDVYDMNELVNDPFKLEEFLKNNGLLKNSDLKIMLTGDSWSSVAGFNIDNKKKMFFEKKAEYIKEYKVDVSDKLEAYYKLENRKKPNFRIIEKFERQIKSIPRFLRSRLGDYEYKITLFNDESSWSYLVNPKKGIVNPCSDLIDNGSEVKIPIKVFIDSVAMNMFHHSSISKRNKYVFADKSKLFQYERFQDLLEYVELEVFPIRTKYIFNLIKAYSRRWREVIVYFQAYLLKRKGMPMYDIEEEILKKQ